jgi:hypothetical protein
MSHFRVFLNTMYTIEPYTPSHNTVPQQKNWGIHPPINWATARTPGDASPPAEAPAPRSRKLPAIRPVTTKIAGNCIGHHRNCQATRQSSVTSGSAGRLTGTCHQRRCRVGRVGTVPADCRLTNPRTQSEWVAFTDKRTIDLLFHPQCFPLL